MMKTIRNILINSLIFTAAFGVGGCSSYSLWQATCEGNLDKVKSILADNPNAVNSRVFNAHPDYRGDTPLHYAAILGYKDLAEYLILKGADVNAKNNNGDTPLHKTIYAQDRNRGGPDLGMIELLIRNGAVINARNDRGYTPLHFAAATNYSKEIGSILISNGADVNAEDSIGSISPLHLAAECRNINMMELLIANGADINAGNTRGFTPLHFAVQNNFVDGVKLLIAKGANINAKNYNGFTPLHIAAQREYQETLKLAEYLIANGAEVNARTNGGVSMIHEINWPYFKLELRVTNGPNGVNATPNNGFTPLHIANENRQTRIADLLRQHGGVE